MTCQGQHTETGAGRTLAGLPANSQRAALAVEYAGQASGRNISSLCGVSLGQASFCKVTGRLGTCVGVTWVGILNSLMSYVDAHRGYRIHTYIHSYLLTN